MERSQPSLILPAINHLLILLLKSLRGLSYDQTLLSLYLSTNFSICLPRLLVSSLHSPTWLT